MDATGGGYRSLWRTSGFSAFDNTFVLARPAALAHVLTRREIAFHLTSARDWDVRGCSGDELAIADWTNRQRGFNSSTRENAP